MSTRFSFNNKYLIKDEQAWFPIMGELHYSRFNHKRWLESLYKMKAAGVSVVSTYTFWIHHEEIEGDYDFSANKDLRKFVDQVKESGLYMFLRIGPWCHGEVRNGGFPDWIMDRDYEARTNDPRYFEDVRKFYARIFQEVDGYFHHQGGPIIGLQIENEYGHCGGLTGQAGEEHMKTLTAMAKEIGYQVPYYTATGWGGAVTGGLIPVMGGYCDAPWDQRLTEIEPSGNYIFTHERNDHNIGSDYGFGEGITFDIDAFPFLTAELGGGLQVTHHRRPIASGKDISAMSLTKLGSGVNLLGYYMYHGGTNPEGKLSTLQESRETGYLNDYQVFNYDFQAAFRQDGQVSETAKELKLWAYFAQDFGQDFCLMDAYIPEENPLFPTDQESIRYAVRRKGDSGYLFINNYQKNQTMAEHTRVSLRLPLDDDSISFDELHIENGDFFFYPFNMRLGNRLLTKATASPLCKIGQDTFVFYSHERSEFEFADGKARIQDDSPTILVLNRQEALKSWKVKGDQDYLFVAEGIVYNQGDDMIWLTRNAKEFSTYPDLTWAPDGYEYAGKEDNGLYRYVCSRLEEEGGNMEACSASIHLENMLNKSLLTVKPRSDQEFILEVNYETLLSKSLDEDEDILVEERLGHLDINDLFLNIDYVGDMAKLYVDDHFVADHFYFGPKWEVGLRNLGYPKQIRLEIIPLDEEAKVYMEIKPKFENGCACKLHGIQEAAEYKHCLFRKEEK